MFVEAGSFDNYKALTIMLWSMFNPVVVYRINIVFHVMASKRFSLTGTWVRFILYQQRLLNVHVMSKLEHIHQLQIQINQLFSAMQPQKYQ